MLLSNQALSGSLPLSRIPSAIMKNYEFDVPSGPFNQKRVEKVTVTNKITGVSKSYELPYPTFASDDVIIKGYAEIETSWQERFAADCDKGCI